MNKLVVGVVLLLVVATAIPSDAILPLVAWHGLGTRHDADAVATSTALLTGRKML